MNSSCTQCGIIGRMRDMGNRPYSFIPPPAHEYRRPVCYQYFPLTKSRLPSDIVPNNLAVAMPVPEPATRDLPTRPSINLNLARLKACSPHTWSTIYTPTETL